MVERRRRAGGRAATVTTSPPRLREVVDMLARHHGRQEPPPTTDPFELVLWENVAYLASPARRREAFALLKSTVGTDPTSILAADAHALERATSRGILKETFADKLRACAGIALHDLSGELDVIVRGPADAAKKALRSFPGIGEPGAEKILLFSGRQPFLAPESNALRVLARLGLIREEKSYAKTYAAARAAGEDLPAKPAARQQAHLLLQHHGQTLCKRSTPRCEVCPLRARCAHANATH